MLRVMAAREELEAGAAKVDILNPSPPSVGAGGIQISKAASGDAASWAPLPRKRSGSGVRTGQQRSLNARTLPGEGGGGKGKDSVGMQPGALPFPLTELSFGP